MISNIEQQLKSNNKVIRILTVLLLLLFLKKIVIPSEGILTILAMYDILIFQIIGISFIIGCIFVYAHAFKYADSKNAFKNTLMMIGIIFIYGTIMTLILGTSGETSNDEIIIENLKKLLDYPLSLMIQIVIITLSAPLIEEFIYRFLIYFGIVTMINEKYDGLIIVLITTLFSIAHVHYNEAFIIMIVEFLSYVVPSFLLTYYFINNKKKMGYKKAYYTNVLTHSFYNIFVLILMIAPIFVIMIKN